MIEPQDEVELIDSRAHLEVALGRLSNQADQVEEFLGADLYTRLKRHAAKLSETAVRGRTPRALVEDKDQRAALYKEIDAALKKVTVASVAKSDEVLVKFKSYLNHKLK